MARTGMSSLIKRLRAMCDDIGQDDFSDDELQNILDANRLLVQREPLLPTPRYAGGLATYFDYHSRHGDFEETGETGVFIVEDSTGADVTPDAINYISGHVQFSVDTEGVTYYLTGRSYDLFGAAAGVWRMMAGRMVSKFDFSADGVKFSRGQWFNHCQQMAGNYDRLTRPSVGTMMRGDVA